MDLMARGSNLNEESKSFYSFSFWLSLGVPIPIPNSGIPVLKSMPNSGIENWEIPVFQKQKMAIFCQILL